MIACDVQLKQYHTYCSVQCTLFSVEPSSTVAVIANISSFLCQIGREARREGERKGGRDGGRGRRRRKREREEIVEVISDTVSCIVVLSPRHLKTWVQ